MGASSNLATALAIAGTALLTGTAADAKCTRMGFTVNDYGKDGPTRDAKELLDKHIAEWASSKGIKKFTVGKKDVKCELFLNLLLFDEHTCTASASVCWDEPGSATPQEAALEEKPAKAKKPAATADAKAGETPAPAPAAAAAVEPEPAPIATETAEPAPVAAPAAATAAAEPPAAAVAAPPVETGTLAAPAADSAAKPDGPPVPLTATPAATAPTATAPVSAADRAAEAAAAAERAAQAAERAAEAAEKAAAAAVLRAENTGTATPPPAAPAPAGNAVQIKLPGMAPATIQAPAKTAADAAPAVVPPVVPDKK